MHKYTISTAWITTNYSCNNNCIWCYASNEIHSNRKMNYEKAKEVVDLLCELGIKKIILIGGEPTLYTQLFELIEYIKSKNENINVGITTNGIKLSDLNYVKQLKTIGLNGCNISLKGLSEKEYQMCTGNITGYFDCLKAIQNSIHLGLNLTVSYVFSTMEVAKVNSLYQFCMDNHIKKLMIQFVKPTIGKDNSSMMRLKDMALLTEYIYKNWEDDIDYKIEASFPLCLIDRTILNELQKKHKLLTGCHIRTGSGINIDPEGKVIPCNHFIDLPYVEKSLESISDIEIIRNTQEYKLVREKASTYVYPNCKQCTLWKICGGGCFTRWFYETP